MRYCPVLRVAHIDIQALEAFLLGFDQTKRLLQSFPWKDRMTLSFYTEKTVNILMSALKMYV